MDVSIDLAAPVARITVHRPEARNAMTFAMYQALYDACEVLDRDPAVRVVIVRGGGGTFIAGTDIHEFVHVRTAEESLAYERRIGMVADRLERMSKTTIAAIEGHAVGGGLTIALACDLRYAASDARLGVPIARTLGNCLSMANTGRLIESVGPARARELLLTARLLTADEAHAIGLLNGSHPRRRWSSASWRWPRRSAGTRPSQCRCRRRRSVASWSATGRSRGTIWSCAAIPARTFVPRWMPFWRNVRPSGRGASPILREFVSPPGWRRG